MTPSQITSGYLSGKFLVAMPQMGDPRAKDRGPN